MGRWLLAGALAAAGCGSLSGSGVALGYTGVWYPSCAAVGGTGAMVLQRPGVVHAGRVGEGEILCADGSRIHVDVRQPARVEIVVLVHEGLCANKAYYVYTHVYDAQDNLLSADDRFQWSATNAEIRPGTCPSPVGGCIADSTAATIIARPPSTMVTASYAEVSASLTLPVCPACGEAPRVCR